MWGFNSGLWDGGEEGNNKGSRKVGLGDVKTLKEEKAGSKWPCYFSHWFFWTHTAMNHLHGWGTELADWVPCSWLYGTVPWTWLGTYPRGRGSWAGLQGPCWRGTESRRQGSKPTCSKEQLVGALRERKGKGSVHWKDCMKRWQKRRKAADLGRKMISKHMT